MQAGSWAALRQPPHVFSAVVVVLSILALFKIPLGTALGIYTLWVLAPAASEAEWRAIARPV